MTTYNIDEITTAFKEVLNNNINNLNKNPSILAYENIANKTDNANLTDYIENYHFSDRTIVLEDISDGIGTIVSYFIKIHNDYDDLNEIPTEQRKPIKVYINSNGGDVSEAFTCIDAIKLSKTPVYTINIGKAYSSGFLIFVCGHKRLCYPNSTFLFHEGCAGMEGDAHKFRNFADFYQKSLKQIKKITLENTKFTEDFYNTHSKDDFWFFADEAVALGVADQIADSFL